MMTINQLKEREVEPETCKGLFWRGSISCYISSYKSIETKKSLRLLKRKFRLLPKRRLKLELIRFVIQAQLEETYVREHPAAIWLLYLWL